MLQEASKFINNAFQQSFTKRLCQYLHDCIREEVKSATFRNLHADKDNKWQFLDGNAGTLVAPNNPIKLDGADGGLTELMLQADTMQKDRYMIFGFLFLEGKLAKKKNVFIHRNQEDFQLLPDCHLRQWPLPVPHLQGLQYNLLLRPFLLLCRLVRVKGAASLFYPCAVR